MATTQECVQDGLLRRNKDLEASIDEHKTKQWGKRGRKGAVMQHNKKSDQECGSMGSQSEGAGGA
jgi:hypothetical protein